MDDRKTSGVMPSIEVKKPEAPEPLDPEELADKEANPDPQATPEASPSPKASPEPQRPAPEDVQLKKALEILRGENAAGKTA